MSRRHRLLGSAPPHDAGSESCCRHSAVWRSGILLLVGLPLVFQSYLRIMRPFQPGLGWAITLCGWFALVWAVISTVIAAHSLSARSLTQPLVAERAA
jgi:hypothetical protein